MANGARKMEMPGFREDVRDVLDAMLAGRSDVRRGSMFGLPGYFTGKKMFVCCVDDGVGVKLPVERVKELQQSDSEMRPHAPGGRVMKEWVYIARSNPNDLHGDLPLLEESIAFVSEAG